MRYLYSLRAEDLTAIEANLLQQEGVGVEIRLDTFSSEPNLETLRQLPCPTLATYRTQAHFGEGDKQTREDAGWQWRLALAKLGCPWIDLEQDEPDLEAKIHQIHQLGAKVVLSQHIEGTHQEVCDAFERGIQLPCDVYKLIGVGKETADFALQRELYQEAADKALVMFWMGADHAFSRVLSLVYGAPFSFVARPEGQALAAGQLSYQILREQFVDHQVDRDQLALFSVIGKPIGHSKSPAFHNPKLKDITPNALFGSLPCETKVDLQELRRAFPEWRGTAVTKPMKEAAYAAATQFRDSGVQALGAANTLLFHGADQIEAANTDYAAMVQLLGNVGKEEVVRVLGYGGLGKAVVQACLDLGLTVEVTNRNPERLQNIPPQAKILAWESRHDDGAAVIVQATSVGMAPHEVSSPLDAIPAGTRTLIETIYNPRETKLMSMAREAAIEVVDGMALFDGQAAIQNELFRGCLRD
jgi:3-dehydroquinate dehydratase/shikimate dehydrogenase